MAADDKIALFDLDGTLADYDRKLESDLESIRSPGEPPINLIRLSGESGKKLPLWLQRRIWMIRDQPGWWRELRRVEAGFHILAHTQALGFRTQILSKGPHSSAAWAEKVDWCRSHLGPDADITITCDKGGSYGRVLVDDWTDYMLSWLEHRPRGLGIMPMTKYNEDFQHPQVIKYNPNIGVISQDVADRLELAFSR